MTIRKDLDQHYQNLDKRLPDRLKPSIRIFETCLRAKDDKESSKDPEIQRIVVRWKHFSFLRRLYADDNVFQEFVSFHEASTSGLTPEEGANIVSPGLSNDIIHTSHVNEVKSMQKDRFAGDFKARFHKILCLHSMAILAIHLAKISTAAPAPTTSEPTQAETDVAEKIDHLWIKESVLAGGKTTEFDLDTQLDGLEVFDFLYLFLLRKIVPYQRLADWIGNDAGEHPFEWNVDGVPNALGLAEWYSLMRLCCKVLLPDDLAVLIKNRTWATPYSYPANKSMYLRFRGTFEHGDQNELGFDWSVDFERFTMVRALCTTSQYSIMEAEKPLWWDHLRSRLVSPFLKNSIYAYQNKIDDIRERSANDADIMRVVLEE